MGKQKKGKKEQVSLKEVKKAIKVTPDGRNILSLKKMRLISFPECLFKLKKLDELDLSCNMIEKLPENIGDLSSLTWLDLHTNKLIYLPESIGRLVGLTYLNLSNNFITSEGLPESVGSLGNLKNLNLGLNQLQTLPPTMEQLSNLEELILVDNRFVEPPEFLEMLQNLKKVKIERKTAEESKIKLSEPEEDVLVHENDICQSCIQKCKSVKQDSSKEERDRKGAEIIKEEKENFAGLTTPNSVARASQDKWRVRQGPKAESTDSS